MERKAQRRAGGRGGAGGAGEPGDADADWVRCGVGYASDASCSSAVQQGDSMGAWAWALGPRWEGQAGRGTVLPPSARRRPLHVSCTLRTVVQLSPERCSPRLPRPSVPCSAYGVSALVEEEVERETAHMRLR